MVCFRYFVDAVGVLFWHGVEYTIRPIYCLGAGASISEME